MRPLRVPARSARRSAQHPRVPSGLPGRVRAGTDDDALVTDAVALTCATCTHSDLRRGSSVRGAIDLAAIAVELERLGSHDGCGGDSMRVLTRAPHEVAEVYRSAVAQVVVLALRQVLGVDAAMLAPTRRNRSRSRP